MPHSAERPTLRDILAETRVIALVGASPKAERASYRVMNFLLSRGYVVVPVNPGQAGGAIMGQTVYASLSDIPPELPVDMVDIFRRSEDVPPVVEEAIAALPGLKTVWMQLGIVNESAADTARAAGLDVVMDHCPAIEIPRLFDADWRVA